MVYLQPSSQTRHVRHESMHMPIEDNLLPLTPHIECFLGNIYYTNLHDSDIPNWPCKNNLTAMKLSRQAN